MLIFTTESIEDIKLKLKHEKDGKEIGEVVVGVSDLRFGQTGGTSTEQQQQQNEPATGDLLNLDTDSTGPAITVVSDSTGGGSSPTPPANNPPSDSNSNSAVVSRSNTMPSGNRTPQPQATNSPNRTSLVVGTAGAIATAGAVNSARSTVGDVSSGSSSPLPQRSTSKFLCIMRLLIQIVIE